ncbi:unnamed protein product [Phytophthora fragariaefolia]|uniref:Unnamed protein product n=1 Tax=Phytophthora fragariaefolia TaxID=1490495 RepID=A0A9W7CR40_9STRA|nr:unnamed protein product [Phytophthora fragariaefolia]
MRSERIVQAQNEEKWIADLKSYLQGNLADLTAEEAKACSKIADDYEVDDDGRLLPVTGESASNVPVSDRGHESHPVVAEVVQGEHGAADLGRLVHRPDGTSLQGGRSGEPGDPRQDRGNGCARGRRHPPYEELQSGWTSEDWSLILGTMTCAHQPAESEGRRGQAGCPNPCVPPTSPLVPAARTTFTGPPLESTSAYARCNTGQGQDGLPADPMRWGWCA